MCIGSGAVELENTLREVLALYDNKLWHNETLLAFLEEDVPKKSMLAELHIAKLSQQVAFLTRRATELEANQQDLRANYLDLVDKLKAIPGLDLSTQTQDRSLQLQHLHKASMHSERTLSMISAITVDTGESSATTMLPSSSLPCGAHGEQFPVYMSDDEAFHGGRSPLLSADLSASAGHNSPTQKLASIPETNHSDTNSDLDEPPTLPNSPFLPLELLPLGEQSDPALESALDEVLQSVAPTDEALEHRSVVVHLLKRLLRISLGATAFEVGLAVSRCLLPCDPIKLTVIIPKSLVPSWHTVVCEQLSQCAERLAYYGSASALPWEDEEAVDAFFSDCQPAACVSPHGLQARAISQVTHSKQNMLHTVQCVVDNISVEISANARAELSVLSFLEDCARAIGRDQLFKRSLLLVRAWWCYETPALVGCVIRHYLTDHQLAVMLLAVFNKYASAGGGVVESPLHALSLFLAEYSQYDGATQAITVQGVVPFATRTSNCPVLCPVRAQHVVSTALLEKHWLSFNIAHAQSEPESPPPIQKKRSTSSEDALHGGGASSSAATSAASSPVPPPPPASLSPSPDPARAAQRERERELAAQESRQHALELAQREQMSALSQHNLFFFDRSAFNVVHPLSHCNMLTEKLSQRRISKLFKVFQVAASNLAHFLKAVRERERDSETERDSAADADALKTFFSASLSLSLSQGAAWPARAPQTTQDLAAVLTCPFDEHALSSALAYCNLMVESVVSDEALQLLAMEILASKGPLPVGEIGKILAELTSIPSLSLRLKERFGGLKKFLELFPGSFVVSNDHPFNPNVLLRCSLPPEQLELIDKGIFPHQLLIKQKKAAAASAAAAKKKKSHSVPGFSASAALGGAANNMSSNSNSGNNNSININNNNMNSMGAHGVAAMERERDRERESFAHGPHGGGAFRSHSHGALGGALGGGGGGAALHHSHSFSALSATSASSKSGAGGALGGALAHKHAQMQQSQASAAARGAPGVKSSLFSNAPQGGNGSANGPGNGSLGGFNSLSLGGPNGSISAGFNGFPGYADEFRGASRSSFNAFSAHGAHHGAPHPHNAFSQQQQQAQHAPQSYSTHAHNAMSFSLSANGGGGAAYGAHGAALSLSLPHNTAHGTGGASSSSSSTAYLDEFLGNASRGETELFFASLRGSGSTASAANNNNNNSGGNSATPWSESAAAFHGAGTASKNGSFPSTNVSGGHGLSHSHGHYGGNGSGTTSFLSSHAAPFEPHAALHGAAAHSNAAHNTHTLAGLFPLELSAEEHSQLNGSGNSSEDYSIFFHNLGHH